MEAASLSARRGCVSTVCAKLRLMHKHVYGRCSHKLELLQTMRCERRAGSGDPAGRSGDSGSGVVRERAERGKLANFVPVVWVSAKRDKERQDPNTEL